MTGGWTDDPEIECPRCEYAWHQRDTFEMGVGNQMECPGCQAWIECVDQELMRRWAWREIATPERGGEGS